MTLTSGDLSWMRASIEELMPDTCVLYAPTNTSDGMGGFTTTWAAQATVKGRIDPVANAYGHEQIAGAAIQPFSRFLLTLPHDTTILATWRAVVNGGTFNVVGVGTANSWALDVRAWLEKVA